MAPASLANFNSQAGGRDTGRGREEQREGEREREGKANKTHVRCRQRVYHLQPVKFIFVQPRLVMRYGSPYSAADSTPNPTPSQSPAPPTLCQVNCERESFGKQKVASANRLEAFRALPNENIFYTSPLPWLTPFCHRTWRVYSWPAIGSTSILESRTKVTKFARSNAYSLFTSVLAVVELSKIKSKKKKRRGNVDKQFRNCITSGGSHKLTENCAFSLAANGVEAKRKFHGKGQGGGKLSQRNSSAKLYVWPRGRGLSF